MINQTEVGIVQRIFDEYAKGKSPRAIAIALNKEGISAPSGKGWTHSTVIGNRKRGTGILNNQLYIGKRIWNRLSYRRNPTTRKRVSKLNPSEDWIVTNVPDLRIIDDALWDRAQALQISRTRETQPNSDRFPDWRHRRPRHLFSGLIKCAECGGGMSLVSRVYYGCSNNRNKGTWTNRLTIRRDRLEETVLFGLQEQLLTPELTAEFIREYTKEINQVRREAGTTHAHTEKQNERLSRQINNIVETVASGRASQALLDRLEQLEAEKQRLDADLAVQQPDPVRIHPNVAELYAAKIINLRESLTLDGDREEAATIFRSLIDEIRLHRTDGSLRVELLGDLATLLGYASATAKNKPGPHGDPGCTEWLVAGARSQRCLHLDHTPL